MSLEGVSVVVTRARHQAQTLILLLEAQGASVIEFPVIEIVDVSPDLHRVDEYDWLVVTSVNTVDHVGDQLRNFHGSVAAIGPGTADALAELGLQVSLVPEQYVAESLVDAFPAGYGKVLLPRAEVAREVLPEGLRAKGWQVDVITAYRTVPVVPEEAALKAVAEADVVTFTASSTVDAFVATGAKVPPVVACIGPVTAETARKHGLTVAIEAPVHTMAGLVSALTKGIESA